MPRSVGSVSSPSGVLGAHLGGWYHKTLSAFRKLFQRASFHRPQSFFLCFLPWGPFTAPPLSAAPFLELEQEQERQEKPPSAAGRVLCRGPSPAVAAAAPPGGSYPIPQNASLFLYVARVPASCGWLLLCERGSRWFEFSRSYFGGDAHSGCLAATDRVTQFGSQTQQSRRGVLRGPAGVARMEARSWGRAGILCEGVGSPVRSRVSVCTSHGSSWPQGPWASHA